MNTSIFLYDEIGTNEIRTNEFIDDIMTYIQDKEFHDGQVGKRVDIVQKKRKDFFITEHPTLRMIDNFYFDKMYAEINTHFGDIKYREAWKIGKYYGDQEGFYQAHRDTVGDTKYRKMSTICSLTDPNEYEGGCLVFDELGLEFKLKKGQVIIFDSSLLHKVTPVTSGIRTVLIGFMFGEEGCQIKHDISQYSKFSSYIERYIPILDNIILTYNNDLIKNTDANSVTPVSLGDIDYSDKHKGHPWKDMDDYYMEDNGGDTLLVLFAGMGWKEGMPTFVFHNFLKENKNVDKLFLRDTGPKNSQQICCRYYMLGFRHNTNNLQESIDFVSSLINREKYKKVYGIGVSAGGFASILFGHLLKFDKVIAFSPQVVLNKKKEEMLGDKINAPKTCQWLTNKNKEDEFYQKCLDLKNFLPFDTKIDVHYAKMGSNGVDKKHALYLEGNNCKIIEHDSSNHMLALELRDNGKLKEIIDEAIVDISV
jgi:predicted 2-oxoglutarate/Fe(II)-dependent dioxygenase YbiX